MATGQAPLLISALVVAVWFRLFFVGVVAFAAALTIAHLIYSCIHRRLWMKDRGPEQRANERIDAFVLANPDWSFRVYRTPAGLRLLAMHRTFDPSEPAVAACFGALQTDTI